MRVHEISSIGKVTLDAFSFYVIIGEMEKAISSSSNFMKAQ